MTDGWHFVEKSLLKITLSWKVRLNIVFWNIWIANKIWFDWIFYMMPFSLCCPKYFVAVETEYGFIVLQKEWYCSWYITIYWHPVVRCGVLQSLQSDVTWVHPVGSLRVIQFFPSPYLCCIGLRQFRCVCSSFFHSFSALVWYESWVKEFIIWCHSWNAWHLEIFLYLTSIRLNR